MADIVLGRRIDLPDGGLVFFGTDDDVFFIGFKNIEGEELKFKLTRMAKDALLTLMTDDQAGLPLAEFPHKLEWRVVETRALT
jgi:hypothetical protein